MTLLMFRSDFFQRESLKIWRECTKIWWELTLATFLGIEKETNEQQTENMLP